MPLCETSAATCGVSTGSTQMARLDEWLGAMSTCEPFGPGEEAACRMSKSGGRSKGTYGSLLLRDRTAHRQQDTMGMGQWR